MIHKERNNKDQIRIGDEITLNIGSNKATTMVDNIQIRVIFRI